MYNTAAGRQFMPSRRMLFHKLGVLHAGIGYALSQFVPDLFTTRISRQIFMPQCVTAILADLFTALLAMCSFW
jgi:hypothetical protein